MTLRMQAEIAVDGKQAKAELQATGKEAAKTATGFDKISKEAGPAGRDVDRLQKEAAELRAELQRLSAVQTGATKGTGQLARGNRLAAGSMANLTAQGNDVITMLVAGQAPMQLALQQGTQITQVLNTMGGRRDIIRGLGQSFMMMVNPVSLVTLGVIAGGAALGQWGLSALKAADDADELLERLDAAEEKAKTLNSELRGLRLGVDQAELALLDDLRRKQEALTEANKRARRFGPQAKASPAAFEEVRLAREALEAYRQAVAEKTTLEQATRDVADAERLLGEQLSQTSVQLREAEAIAGLLKQGVSATTIEAVQLAGVDLASPMIDAEAAAALLELGLSDSVLRALELSGISISGEISEAADEAARLADELFRASRVGLRKSLADEDDVMSQPVEAASTTSAAQRFEALVARAARKSSVGGTGGGRVGGGRSRSSEGRLAGLQRDAIDRLIKSKQRELDILREEDPVRREMIRLRDTLAGASEQERAQVEGLISAYREEKVEIDARAERIKAYEDIFRSATDELISGTGDLSDAWDAVTDAIKRAAIQAIVFGEGPFGGIFGGGGGAGGGSGGGGLLGGLVGGLFNGFAGFFDKGGRIPSGKFGIAGEFGPELVSGPAVVTSRADTARLMGTGGTLRILLDDRLIGDIIDQNDRNAIQIVSYGVAQNNRLQGEERRREVRS